MSQEHGSLVFHDHKSSEFGVWINNPWVPVHPTTDGTSTHITGRNGDYFLNNGSFNNVTETFNCTVERDPNIYKDWFELEDALSDWLQIGGDFDYLELSIYPQWAFYAQAQPFTLTPSNNQQATLTLSFNCSPVMTAMRGLDYRKIPNGQNTTIVNSTDFTVHPYWHLHGSGDLNLTVNGMIYYFDDVEKDIWLRPDGNAYEIDKDGVKTLCNDKLRLVNNDSPEFLCGNNIVNFGWSKIQVPVGDAPKDDPYCEYKAMWKKVI